ncbi:hypothetical protein ZWY2020_016504 [Hordeum vulgare]|nr:hypothetical protein ZWY2020_016504 [Hordeum vulgare]
MAVIAWRASSDALLDDVGYLPARPLVPRELLSGSSAVQNLRTGGLCAGVHKVGLEQRSGQPAASYSTNLAILCLYTRLSGACRRTWTRFSMEAFAFKELRQFAELVVPSAMMVCLEWWSFELLVLLSGLLPNPKLETSVLSICLNTSTLMFTVPSGLCAAISTRVSNELGAGLVVSICLGGAFVACLFSGSVADGIGASSTSATHDHGSRLKFR